MPRASKPAFQCRFAPRARQNARKLKKCRNVINNFYFGNNQFININNANINQFNFYRSEDQPPVEKTVPKLRQIEDTCIVEPHLSVATAENNDCSITTFAARDDVKNNRTGFPVLPIRYATSGCNQHSLQEGTSDLNPEKGTLSLLGMKYSNTNKFSSICDYNYSLGKPNFVVNRYDTKKFPLEITDSDISSRIEKMSLKENKILDRLCSPKKIQFMVNNTPAELLCQFGRIIRSNRPRQSARGAFGKMNKNVLELKGCVAITEPEIEKIQVASSENVKVTSSETSTPKGSLNVNKTPKQNWELSPIMSVKESSLETTDEIQNESNNVVRALEYDEDNVKINNSEDMFEMTNYFDACKTESVAKNKRRTDHVVVNTALSRELFQTDAIDNQTHDSLCHNSTYRTTRFESFAESDFNEPICGNDTQLSRSNCAGDLEDDDTQNEESFKEKRFINDKRRCIKTCSKFTLSQNSLSFSSDEQSGSTELAETLSFGSFSTEHKACADQVGCYTKVIPGKKWRRSLLDNKRATLAGSSADFNSTRCNWTMRLSINPQGYIELDKTLHKNGFKLRDIAEQVASSNANQDDGTEYDSIIHDSFFDDQDEETDRTMAIHQQVTNILQSDNQFVPSYQYEKVYGEKKVLDICCQTAHIDFSEYVKNFTKCKKTGEGIYGEVFSYCVRKQQIVLKIIPIEGKQLVNFSCQKTYGEVFSEICVALSLSNLKNFIDDNNYTEGFCSILKIACLKGKYPDKFIELWDKYDSTEGSENDSPVIFESDQLYVALEMLYGGEPLENYEFCSARQSYSVLLQVTHALAAAEQAFEFEHRDLHWGNVLISKTCDRNAEYMIDGQKHTVMMYGKKATIIDYTLSRIRSGKFDIYNDLELDLAIFQAYGDYQFDIYRDMRSDVNGQWESFVPKTNVRWLHYLATKCYNGVGYKTTHKIHKTYLRKIRIMRDKILNYSSASDIVRNLLD